MFGYVLNSAFLDLFLIFVLDTVLCLTYHFISNRLVHQAHSLASWRACWWRSYRAGRCTATHSRQSSNWPSPSSSSSFSAFCPGLTTGLTCLASSSECCSHSPCSRTWRSASLTDDGRSSASSFLCQHLSGYLCCWLYYFM